jgi:hypothetical protein
MIKTSPRDLILVEEDNGCSLPPTPSFRQGDAAFPGQQEPKGEDEVRVGEEFEHEVCPVSHPFSILHKWTCSLEFLKVFHQPWKTHVIRT